MVRDRDVRSPRRPVHSAHLVVSRAVERDFLSVQSCPSFLCVLYCIVFYYAVVLFLFCVFVVLVQLSVLAKWLARKTPLRMIAVRRFSARRSGRRAILCRFINLLFVCVFVPGPIQYMSYVHAAIEPICGESAVKHQPTLPTVSVQQYGSRELNQRPVDCKSSTITTTLPSHIVCRLWATQLPG